MLAGEEIGNGMTIVEAELEKVLDVIAQIPEFDSPPTIDAIKSRCANTRYLALVCEKDGEAIGTKLGYALSDDHFYSWLGGVRPAYRRTGVAQKLLEVQESWARENGYFKISVKSMNRYPQMLHFLIQNAYHICGTEGEGDSLKIHFSKTLVPPKVEEDDTVEVVEPEIEGHPRKTDHTESMTVVAAEILGQSTGRIKDLKGFQKRYHKVPDNIDARTRSFVENIGEEDLQEKAEELFAQIRSSLGYKRREISVENEGASAKLTTKDFDLYIDIKQSESISSQFVFDYRLTSQHSYGVLDNTHLDGVFGNQFNEARFRIQGSPDVEAMIDVFEETEISHLSISYPPDCSELEITSEGEDWKLVVSPIGISLKKDSSCCPSEMAQILKKSEAIFSQESPLAKLFRLEKKN